MAQFKNRDEYERWKAERSKQLAQKTSPPDSDNAKKQPGNTIADVKLQPSGLPGLGELFGRTWEVYKERFLTLIALSLLSILFFLLPLGIFGGSGFALSMLLPDLKTIVLGIFITIGIVISMYTLFWGMSGFLFALTDETLTVGEALGRGRTKSWGLIWLLTLLGFLTTGGFLLFFIPGVIFTVWFVFGQFILIEDDERGMRALLKSREFVRGYGLEIFIRVFVIWLISVVIAIIPLIGPLLSLLFLPYLMIFIFHIYQDIKAIKGDVAFAGTTGDKVKWLGTAMLGYILVPVIIIAIFGASLFSSLLFLRGMLALPGTEIFSPATQPLDKAGESSDVVRPSNFHELLGTWSGREIGGSLGWTFSFSDGYNVHAVSPEGHSYSGNVGIHWRLGGDERGLQVPPGAGVFDVNVTESSSAEIVGKTSVGAFSVYNGNLLKLCSGEPGKTKRPESFDPVPGIKCFELTKTAEAPPAQISPSPGMSQSLPQADPEAAEDDETRAARTVFKQFTAAYQAGNMPVAKSYFSQTTLGEMERSGQVDMAMGMISGTNIDEFSALREGNKITFSQSSKQGEATMSMSFTMVRENGGWKLGN